MHLNFQLIPLRRPMSYQITTFAEFSLQACKHRHSLGAKPPTGRRWPVMDLFFISILLFTFYLFGYPGSQLWLQRRVISQWQALNGFAVLLMAIGYLREEFRVWEDAR
jgi:hypothetical protein